ncbi:hypothetical protein [Anditalea andensis]|uniref:Glycosyltransferase n=1 Tax=Anditalea andensis TaxID=1048983 RepID=A0A074KYE6_9BACT|nr:hypothetical protein [Anditalea andensis]KEO72593.1 hypothetical protein EL17_17805 [Anditalea andensis]
MKIKCELQYHKSRHLNQVYAGFEKLYQNNIIDLKVSKTEMVEGEDMVCRVLINGKYKVIYDTLDGLNWIKKEDESLNLKQFQKLTREVDFYFKRSYLSDISEYVAPSCSYLPLGLNYNVVPDHKLVNDGLLESLKKLSRPKQLYRDVLNRKVEQIPSSSYEYGPRVNIPNKVLFLCRLWEYEMYDDSPIFQAQIEQINKSRIASIRACKEAFGDNFIGGVYDNPTSLKYAPDLIVSNDYTHKLKFLHHIRSANICIGTTGLHNSIGWKLGEYVAASRAIISEPLHFGLPGDFVEGINYLKFTNTEELIANIQMLLDSPNKLKAMMEANHAYYNAYLKPDQMILNTLHKVLSLEK